MRTRLHNKGDRETLGLHRKVDVLNKPNIVPPRPRPVPPPILAKCVCMCVCVCLCSLTLVLLVWGSPKPGPLSTSPIRKSDTLKGSNTYTLASTSDE